MSFSIKTPQTRELDGTILRIGIHKGKDLSSVPTDYLMWLRDVDWSEDETKFEIQNQLNLRAGLGVKR